ncbi:hypothetical protein EPN52_07420 [bacterium]|nr:MAG: hypothetical protein EPN52_07420 [bacterium]
MLQLLALAYALSTPVLAVTPAIPPAEMGTVPAACRADDERLRKQAEVVVAYRNAVALLTKNGTPVMPGATQQRATDAFNGARGAVAKPSPGPAQQAQQALVQLYAAADPLDELVMQYASDLQSYVDEVAGASGSEPTRISAPPAGASNAEVQTWNVVQQDVGKLATAVAKIDAALSAERDAHAAYLTRCRGGAPAATAPATAAPATATPVSSPTAAAAAAAPATAQTSAVASPAAAQLQRAFAVLIDWLKNYHEAHGTYPERIDPAVLADADALNPFHSGFGYRSVRSTYYLGTFTGLCACDDEIAAGFAARDDWYERAGKHAPFHAPGIWYTPSVYFR